MQPVSASAQSGWVFDSRMVGQAKMVRAVFFTLFVVLINASLLFLFPFSLTRFLLCALVYAAGNVLMIGLLFHPRSQVLVVNRSRVACEGNPCVALTFDDGPTPDHTPRVLEILREKGVKATFFLIASRAEKERGLVRRMCAEGHCIGNHTYTHPALFCFLSPSRLREEISKGEEVIRDICGSSPRLFRSPVGLRHPLLDLYLKRAGIEYISWRLRAFDTRVQKPEVITKRILGKVTPGDIILLHDNSNAGVRVMLDVLPDLIDKLKARGFDFVLVK
jgi:peptidoglycan/xylan/chitin deacetylase (PgdA/CDA1 family)